MLATYRDAAYDLLRRGATPADIDGAVEGFGFAMGPFRMGDLAGNDIGWAIRKRRYAEHPDLPRDEIADALCELGRFGQKTGAGWYDYDGRTAVPSPVVDDLLADYWQPQRRAAHGIRPARRSCSAWCSRSPTPGRGSSRRASRCARPTSTWSTWPATASRGTRAARCSTPTGWACRWCWPRCADSTATTGDRLPCW